MLSSQLAITIWDLAGNQQLIPYGGTTVKLFDDVDWYVGFIYKYHPFPSNTFSSLKRGRQKLKIWLDQPADGMSNSSTSSTVVNTKEAVRIEAVCFNPILFSHLY